MASPIIIPMIYNTPTRIEIPPEVVKDVIFPFLDIIAIIRLSKTCKKFSLDDTDWHFLCKRDYDLIGGKYTYKNHIPIEPSPPKDHPWFCPVIMVLVIIAIIIAILVAIFGTIGIIFSALPDTRSQNIGSYNKIVDNWSTLQPILNNYKIHISTSMGNSNASISTSVPDLQDRRPTDNFTNYIGNHWITNVPAFKDEPYSSKRLDVYFKITDDSGAEFTSGISYQMFYSISYCCAHSDTGCFGYCDNYYVISGICVTFNLVNKIIVPNQGCVRQGLSYSDAMYRQMSIWYKQTDLNFYVQVREVHDPWYNIPFIIGFGSENSWGVTMMDNIIILSVFFGVAIIGCVMLGIILCIMSIIVMVDFIQK